MSFVLSLAWSMCGFCGEHRCRHEGNYYNPFCSPQCEKEFYENPKNSFFILPQCPFMMWTDDDNRVPCGRVPMFNGRTYTCGCHVHQCELDDTTRYTPVKRD
ncbi:MAG: hypothetical protein Satyrvirus3_23 [Satyrvirus sp.]|uniref:Uncharacterized protein n=1 Tax=Satyrvirus sp. TaxID=2487771 RepID=A0A3G5AD46_9VIRU|nr:MAG: hypothetical protein Satyrvirus3_23 [Satyrvirus sp.]